MKFVCLFVLISIFSTGHGEMETLLDAPLPDQIWNVIDKGILDWSSSRCTKARNFISRRNGPTARIETKMGIVDGSLLETCRKGQQYGAFFGMPYGKPPVGDQRFRAPVPADPWEGVYDATFERPACLRFQGLTSEESEDCLYINVYTPSWKPGAEPKAVMVFIYGGAFLGGSSQFSVYAPDLFIENDVILVTFNYRLGVLGFLSMQTEDIPGNAGLKDQKLALEWVRDNIMAFGGDPNSVTVFGESAGSASINYHLLSNSSTGLFQRAILESGVATSPWAFIPAEDSVRIAKNLAKTVKCPQSGPAMAECLRKVSAYTLTAEQEKGLTLKDILTLRPISFVPTREPDVKGAFLTQDPVDILTAKTFNQVPVIIGFNSREGLLFLPTLKSLDPINIAVNLFSYNLCSFFPTQAKSTLTNEEKNYLNSVLRRFYSSVKPVGSFNAVKMIDIITDVAFMVPVQFTAAILAGGSQPVYNYIFTYDGAYGYFKSGLKIKEKGVCHGDELGYLFYDEGFRNFVNESRYAECEHVANTIMSSWTNFAKTGNPTPDGSAEEWQPRAVENPIYAEFGKEFKISQELSAGLDNRYKFWAKIITEIVDSDDD